MPFEQGSRNGFLAITAQEYAAHIAYILALSPEGRDQVHNYKLVKLLKRQQILFFPRCETEHERQLSCSAMQPSSLAGFVPQILFLQSFKHRSPQ